MITEDAQQNGNDVTCNGVAQQGDAAPDATDGFKQRSKYDIEAASSRQRMFYYQVDLSAMSQERTIKADRALGQSSFWTPKR